MAQLQQSKLVTKQMQWHANMTEKNHLGAALMIKPHVFTGKMNQLFTASRYSDNTLTSMLVGAGKEEFIGETEWEWELKGASTRPLVIVENVEPASNTQLGRYRQNFKIKLDENWYLPGDILNPAGLSDKRYQCRVQEAPYRHGNGWVYTLRIVTDNPALFIKPEWVNPGTQWSKLYSQYEEAGEQSGSTQYSLPISLRNGLNRFRKEYKVTGDVHNQVLAIQIPDSKGRMHNTWISYAEVEYWEQWYRELERGYWYTRSSNTTLGANGRPIFSRPGIQEQLEDSHVHRYSHLSATLVEEYLMDIYYSRVKPGSGRKTVGFTGEYGMLQFHRAIMDWASKKGFIQVVDSLFIDKTKSQYHDNALVAGYQYVKYRMANGAELELVHNPLYDDREINSEIDPVTGFPVESQRITFLDFSGQGGASNIKRVAKKDGMSLAYISGLVSPYGNANKTMAAHSGDYYEMHVKDMCGVHIEDVGKCGELILSRN